MFIKYKLYKSILFSESDSSLVLSSTISCISSKSSCCSFSCNKLLNISDTEISYITNVGAGEGLSKIGSAIVPFENKFPKNTELYKLMTTKPGEEFDEG